ncbi:hypothetical protein RRG08_053062 [Elysia crispata]|uniref:Uncharacterized protein n=1 Tax=Elysia crispata TaxID=231223 RepID=A0AAE1CLC0_9GAST|nr:hypothetical protein RRG08_053062 [Elysia crispata]
MDICLHLIVDICKSQWTEPICLHYPVIQGYVLQSVVETILPTLSLVHGHLLQSVDRTNLPTLSCDPRIFATTNAHTPSKSEELSTSCKIYNTTERLLDSLLGIVVVHADLSLAPLESLEPADIGKSWENIAPSTFLWFYLDHKFRRGHVSCWLRKTRDDVLKKKLEAGGFLKTCQGLQQGACRRITDCYRESSARGQSVMSSLLKCRLKPCALNENHMRPQTRCPAEAIGYISVIDGSEDRLSCSSVSLVQSVEEESGVKASPTTSQLACALTQRQSYSCSSSISSSVSFVSKLHLIISLIRVQAPSHHQSHSCSSSISSISSLVSFVSKLHLIISLIRVQAPSHHQSHSCSSSISSISSSVSFVSKLHLIISLIRVQAPSHPSHHYLIRVQAPSHHQSHSCSSSISSSVSFVFKLHLIISLIRVQAPSHHQSHSCSSSISSLVSFVSKLHLIISLIRVQAPSHHQSHSCPSSISSLVSFSHSCPSSISSSVSFVFKFHLIISLIDVQAPSHPSHHQSHSCPSSISSLVSFVFKLHLIISLIRVQAPSHPSHHQSHSCSSSISSISSSVSFVSKLHLIISLIRVQAPSHHQSHSCSSFISSSVSSEFKLHLIISLIRVQAPSHHQSHLSSSTQFLSFAQLSVFLLLPGLEPGKQKLGSAGPLPILDLDLLRCTPVPGSGVPPNLSSAVPPQEENPSTGNT